MSSENMKRTGSSESPQIPAKMPKIENYQVNEEQLDEKIENSKINDVLMKKMDKIVKQIERYKSNMVIIKVHILYSEKVTKFCEIFPLLLTAVLTYSQK